MFLNGPGFVIARVVEAENGSLLKLLLQSWKRTAHKKYVYMLNYDDLSNKYLQMVINIVSFIKSGSNCFYCRLPFLIEFTCDPLKDFFPLCFLS